MKKLYKNFLTTLVVMLIGIAMISPTHAQEDIAVNENEVVIAVSGIVCSFCAQGLTKKLSKLSFVDTSKHTKGIMVEIETQRVTVAIKPDEEVDFEQIFTSIKWGGYEPIKAYTADGKVITPEEGI